MFRFRQILIILTLLAATNAFGSESDNFISGAYIPYYRLRFTPGAENELGRPGMDPSPGAWMGRLDADSRLSAFPADWTRGDWQLRLAADYSAFYLHIPLDEDLIEGRSPDSRHISYIKSLIGPDAQKIYLSVIGTSSDFAPYMKDDESRLKLAALLADICRRYGLDGIDLDWEFPTTPRSEEQESLTELASALKDSMPNDSTLSAAVSRWRLPNKEFFEFVDEVHLMAYDGYGKHATYESAIADAEFLLLETGVPAEKLILGLPFYGRIYDPKNDNYWRGTMNYRRIVESFGPATEDDDAGGYYYNGPSTITEKASWAMGRRLGGVFVWEPFHDSDGPESLSSAIRGVINSR